MTRIRLPFWVASAAALFALSSAWMNPASVTAGPGRSAPEIVGEGTHFLIRLEQPMNTGKIQANDHFEATTIEPLATSTGAALSPGARITGHISRVDRAGVAGRAHLWLAFDDIETRRGMLPIVAEVSSVPGEFNVQTSESREGEIEARGASRNQVLESTAGGAAMGAAPGVTAHNAKSAAEGAATAGVAAFLASSGLGHEIDLPKGTKLELVLLRPLYLKP